MAFKHSYDEKYFESLFYKAKEDSLRDKRKIEEILKYKKSGKLLEIGSAEGYFLKLASKHFSVEGIEISEYAGSLAQEFLKEKVLIANIEQVTLPKKKYDVVVAYNVLEHLKEPKKTVANICDSLKEAGILIGSVPNNQLVVGKITTKFWNKFIDGTHVSTYRFNKWERIFNEAGFGKCEFFGEWPLGRNRNVYIKNKAWRFISFNLMFVCRKNLVS